MRTKTVQPTRKHPTTSSSQPSGLIVNELKPGRSDGEKSALDDRSHRTTPSECGARIKGCVKERRRTFPLTNNQRVPGCHPGDRNVAS